MKAFVSWSGGKETSLACYRAMRTENIVVSYLLNMITEDGEHSRTHGLSSAILRCQSEVLGIPMMQGRAGWGNYEEAFRKAVSGFKKDGVRVGIFGDIDFQEHRDWVERVCEKMEITPLLPLWGEEREKLLMDFIGSGFEAIVVATKADSLGEEWLGRRINEEFIEDLKKIENIDLCGEKGEYHTFVYDGPIFKRPVKFEVGRKYLKEGHWFLEIICASRKLVS